jgi:hypothetical protein
VIGRIVTRFAAGLRFPTLFKLVAALFVVDLFMPDLIPLLDEILLALGTLLLAALRKRRSSRAAVPPSSPPAVSPDGLAASTGLCARAASASLARV